LDCLSTYNVSAYSITHDSFSEVISLFIPENSEGCKRVQQI
jgi:hypothetical protein